MLTILALTVCRYHVRRAGRCGKGDAGELFQLDEAGREHRIQPRLLDESCGPGQPRPPVPRPRLVLCRHPLCPVLIVGRAVSLFFPFLPLIILFGSSPAMSTLFIRLMTSRFGFPNLSLSILGRHSPPLLSLFFS